MDSQPSYDLLVKGIQSIDVRGDFNPCKLLLTGDQAQPVLKDSKGQVLIAASQYGKGRMVVMGHEAMLKLPQFLPFIKNALDWLKPSPASSSPMALVGVHRSLDALSKLLLSNGIKVHPDATLGDSPEVFCRDAYDSAQADDLVLFVKRGGGLLIGGQAWHWSSEHGKDAVLIHFPGNLVTSVAGVYFTDNMGENAILPVSEKIPRIPLITEHGLNIERDLRILLNRVKRLNVKGLLLPSPLLVHGTLAFPVGISDKYHCFLAAAYYGRGRIIVAGREGFLEMPSMIRFFLNAINWLSAETERKMGIGESLQGLYSMLNEALIPCELTNFKEGLGIYCCMVYDAKDIESIHEFVSEGGGLLIGGQAWYWDSVKPDSSAIAEYPGNKILNKFGIAIVGKFIELYETNYPVGEVREIASTYHFRKALWLFKKHIRKEQGLKLPYSLWLQKLVRDIAIFLEIPAMNSHPFSSVHEEVLELAQIKGIPEVGVHSTIQANTDIAILLQLASVLYNAVPEFQALVPSLMPNDPNSYPIVPPQNVQVNGSNTENEAWRSTGMFAPPASTVTLLFPASTLNAKLQVQIGCHIDNLVNDKRWRRPPVVTRRFKVKTAKMEVSSLWGGLLYIIVPENSSLGYFSITIEGATQAPYFKHGETSIQDWQDTIRHYPAPWAELETENIILTLPSDTIRSHDGIAFLLQTWDQMMRAITHLAAIPPIFPRPERVVANVQISEDWVRTGYPIMIHLWAVPAFIDVQAFYTKGTWGPIHELGHNQQKNGWNFPPHTDEATCNLWAVYVNETVLSISREIAHPDLQPGARKERIENYIRNGANLDDFEVFTALEPYLQLQEAFGWDPYIHIFAKYQTMSNIPDEKKDKMNLWVETFSQEVKRNLAPFFKTWGWPIEDSVSEKLALFYPAWAEDPMIEIPENSSPAGEACEIASTYHFRKAFLKFKEHIQNELILETTYSLWRQRLVQEIAIFLEIPATNSRPFSSVHEEALELVQIKGIPEVSVHNRIQANSDQAILLQIASVLYNVLPEFQALVPSLMPNDPNSYPIAPPQNIQVNGSNKGNEAWRSTGMYAPPATTVTLLFPSSTLNAKLQVQIGCHTDNLVDLKKWKRPPMVTRQFPVQTEKMEVSGLWGGLLYIIVPENSSLGYFSVTIEGATQAPYFKHGETSIQDWQDTICHYPAPWAELETENIILTLPSDAVRSHEGIAFLLQTWDQMMRAITHLAAIPPIFPRPERIVADVQIAAGWMHAGYPIMSDVGALSEIIDVQDFYAKGTWGPIHELGHNQQKSGWNFSPHTDEATCNLWSVYINETVLSISREIAHPELQPHARKERIENYIRNGANLDDFEVFTALEPYLQLQEAFGWDPYIRIFAKYQTMSNIPDEKKDKMNLWAETFSQEVNRNLAPFFKTWGWPIEDSVSEKLALSYPAWAEDPMIEYRHS
ncbi:TRPM8 channel-associated factor homolog [Ahaetulla prasina]|uniref:TRPM8 channel-associated factor homolog n=1 Tax=Ahaetulla prasina TaxID=499056 RepID=UPI0026489825|nr:TRPM8 channel-associated factor homolog [Ahaetulla prasina]